MTEIGSEEPREQPLPRAWLPEALPPAGADAWRVQHARIVAAASEHLLVEDSIVAGADHTWYVSFGSRWLRAGAGLAAAAAIALMAARTKTSARATSSSMDPLNVISSDVQPQTIWQAYGIEADPVLAVIAIEPRP